MAGNFLSDILGQFTNIPDPSYMQQPRYANALTQAQSYAPPEQYPQYDINDPGGLQAKAYATAGVPQGRQRGSVIDILGGLADSVAKIGGVDPGYQPTLDAANDRQRQAEGDQMARDKFGLEKQKYGQDIRKTDWDMQQEQNKVLGVASGILSHALQTQGPEGASRIFGELGSRLGMTPEQLQQEQAHFNADPQGYITAMSAFGKAGKDAEYGTSVYYAKGPDGKLHPFQASTGGGLSEAQLPEGYQIQPTVKILDNGNENTVIQGPGGAAVATYAKGGTPSADQTATRNPDGSISLAPTPGGKLETTQDTAAQDKVNKLEGLQSTLEQGPRIITGLRSAVTNLADTGGMTGVPGQSWLGNLRALGYQNVPGVERVVNSKGASNRKVIDSMATDAVLNLQNAVNQATGAGIKLSASLINTVPEVKARKSTIVNAEDYKSANTALDNFEAQLTSAYAQLQKEIDAAKSQGSRAPAQNTPTQNAPAASGGWKLLGTE